MSMRAVLIPGMLQPVHVMTIVSMLRSASGMRSAKTFEEVEGNFHVLPLALGSRQQARRRIESEDFAGLSRIEGKIKSGADADVEDAPFGCARDALAIRTKPLVAHRKIDERRQNPFLIEAHRRPPRAEWAA